MDVSHRGEKQGLAVDAAGVERPPQGVCKDEEEVEEVPSQPDNNFAGESNMMTLIKGMAQNTGMQGLPNIQRAKGFARRIFWLLIVLAGIGLLIWKVTEAFIKYYDYPTDTLITFEFSPVLTFPAVTICNLNPMRLSALHLAGPDIMDLFGASTNLNNAATTAASVNPSASPNVTTNVTHGGGLQMPSSFFDWTTMEQGSGYYNREDSDFQKKETFMSHMAMLDWNTRTKIGHSIDWMLISCSFEGKMCSPSNFTLFTNYLYGNCYTFNANLSTRIDGLNVSKVGPLYGLSLELYVQQAEYIPALADAAGFRVLIHNQTHMPFPEDTGFSTSPGQKTSIGLKRVEITRAPKAYGNCKIYSDEENLKINAFSNELPKINYTNSACKKTCYQQHLVRECMCYDPKYPFCQNCTTFAAQVNTTRKLWPCSEPSNSPKKQACVAVVTKSYMEGTLGCSSQCATECFGVEYDYKLSTSSWPATNSEDIVVWKLLERSQDLWNRMDMMTDGARTGFSKENLLKIEIYYEDLNFKQIVTKSNYGNMELLADVGGQTGFWLGLSIIALFEFVELIVDIFYHIVKKCRKCGSAKVRVGNYVAGGTAGSSSGSMDALHDTRRRASSLTSTDPEIYGASPIPVKSRLSF